VTEHDPLRPADRAALDKAIRLTASTAALRRIRRLITEEEASERAVRKLALFALAIFFIAIVLFLLVKVPAWWLQ
jgi:hypothetical protein